MNASYNVVLLQIFIFFLVFREGQGSGLSANLFPAPFTPPLLLYVYLHCIMGTAEAMPKPNLEHGQHFIGK